MVNKNIQMKEKDGDSWNNLFPLTLQENVFNETGTPLDNVLYDYEQSLNQFNDQITDFNDQMNDLNNEFEIIRRDIIRTVSYNMFREAGMTDEEIIRATHEYANENNLPVHNPTGEFYLEEGTEIPIYTDVDWGETIFHIDEEKSNTKSHFIIKRTEEPIDITNKLNLTNLLTYLKKDIEEIPALSDYPNYLISIKDTTNIEAKRKSGKEWNYQEMFFVHEGGKIEGRFSKDFKNITNVTATYGENNYRSIRGGIFRLSGESNKSGNPYISGGLRIERSRTIVSEMVVEMETPSYDNLGADGVGHSGFFQFYGLYDIQFHNISSKPRKDLKGSSYGIQGDHVVKILFNNVTGDSSENYWGVMGTNKIKKMTILNSQLTRVDVHWDCQDLYISNSEIRSISLTGGGKLSIKDSIIKSNNIIKFRNDYGGIWDGDISIENITMVPYSDNDNTSLIYFQIDDEFNYPQNIIHGKNISIENVTVDCKNLTNVWSGSLGMVVIQNNPTINNKLSTVYHNLTVKNITRENNIKDVRMSFTIDYPHDLKAINKGSYEKKTDSNTMLIQTNLNVSLENIFSDSFLLYLGTGTDAQVNNDNDYKLMPKIFVENVEKINISTRATICDLFISNCSLTDLNAQSSTSGNNSLSKGTFLNCILENETSYKKPYDANLINGTKWE